MSVPNVDREAAIAKLDTLLANESGASADESEKPEAEAAEAAEAAEVVAEAASESKADTSESTGEVPVSEEKDAGSESKAQDAEVETTTHVVTDDGKTTSALDETTLKKYIDEVRSEFQTTRKADLDAIKKEFQDLLAQFAEDEPEAAPEAAAAPESQSEDEKALQELLALVGEATDEAEVGDTKKVTKAIAALTKRVEDLAKFRADSEDRVKTETESRRIAAELDRVVGIYPEANRQELLQSVVLAARAGHEDPVLAIEMVAKARREERERIRAEVLAEIRAEEAKKVPQKKAAAATAATHTPAAVPPRPKGSSSPATTVQIEKAKPKNLKEAREFARKALDRLTA